MYSSRVKFIWRALVLSTVFAEKIEALRAELCLSQPEFAMEIGVSINTYKGIIKRGSSPRFELVQQIATRWPQYAYWLLTDKTHWPRHLAPGQNDQSVLRFFEFVDNVSPEIDDLMTKPEWFGRLVFLQCSDERNDLKAFIETKQPARLGFKQCIFIGGNINYCSDGSGKNGLIGLARYFESVNRPDLIRTSERKLITRINLTALYESWEINESDLLMPDLAKADWLKKSHMNFSAWKMQGVDYEPKYNWQDMEA